MRQAKKVGVLQVALGGGNPNQHPDFTQILRITRDHGVVPSYTTNGQGLNEAILEATKKYCGAMAVSWYEPTADAEETIFQANNYGIKINVHFLLNKESLPRAIALLEQRAGLLEKINALVFLNYKPIHSSEELCVTDGEEVRRFFDIIKDFKTCKIGFDSCMISYLPLISQDLVLESVDFCEAGRFSAYISEDLLFYPCSFLNDTSKNGIDLKTCSLKEAWLRGEEFVKIRSQLRSPGQQNDPLPACQSCESYSFCHGGCQIFNINRCRATAN
jgi:radical SAM protein with 4Fe4S-binding SPASM domain